MLNSELSDRYYFELDKMASSDLPPLTIPDESDTAPGPQTSKSSHNPISSPQASLNSNGGALTPRTIYANRKAEREAISLQMMMHMNAKKVKSIQSQVSLRKTCWALLVLERRDALPASRVWRFFFRPRPRPRPRSTPCSLSHTSTTTTPLPSSTSLAALLT